MLYCTIWFMCFPSSRCSVSRSSALLRVLELAAAWRRSVSVGGSCLRLSSSICTRTTASKLSAVFSQSAQVAISTRLKLAPIFVQVCLLGRPHCGFLLSDLRTKTQELYRMSNAAFRWFAFRAMGNEAQVCMVNMFNAVFLSQIRLISPSQTSTHWNSQAVSKSSQGCSVHVSYSQAYYKMTGGK